jgi:uncharacterized membrane protein YgcG
MFNDLNPGQNNHQPIDDIFAETDKPAAPANNYAGGIETHRVGLTSLNDGAPLVVSNDKKKSTLPWFKILASLIVLAILVLAGYLIYTKFYKSSTAIIAQEPAVKSTNVTPATTNTVTTNSTVNETPVSTSTVYVNPNEIPGLASTSATSSLPNETAVTTTTASSTLDSDNDGLTDAQEAIYHTNPLKVDTDGDGLSDYEEVMIYHTNPLVADTDGDGYTDGNEVKNGYNPNGPGKLPGVNTPIQAVK